MDIISILFALLAIISLFFFYTIPQRYRIIYLTLISCAFIISYHYILLLYVISFSVLNFIIGKKIPGHPNTTGIFRIGLILNLLQLIVLKYASFAIDPFFQLFGSNIQVSKVSDWIVPLGISYFTLQGIGYLINIKMGWEKPERHFSDFLLYIVFYPKFVSGPIERSNHFLPQIKEPKQFNQQMVSEGLQLALFGFFKKVVIANNLGSLVSVTYSDLHSTAGLSILIVVLLQPLYLYFDFSGYTDIARGLARAYGIDLLPNFNKPFLSVNVTSFWKNFHMSLSLWFNDYIFKQASFKYRRWGKYASVFAVFLTFTLFGIWHGAGWNYMILGLVQALAINYEFFTKKLRAEIFSKLPNTISLWLGRLFTYMFFAVSLVLFFSPDLSTAINYYSHLINCCVNPAPFRFGMVLLFSLTCAALFIVYEIICVDFRTTFNKIQGFWFKRQLLRITFYLALIFFIITQISGNKSFIYQMF